MIELNALRRSYRMGSETIDALAGVTFSVKAGEYVVIVGRSGSGKSTLMNLLGCMDTATSGTYHLDGQDVGTLSDDELSRARNVHIGFVFQNFQLLPRATALRNVELPLVYRGIRRRKRREMAQEALARVGLQDRMRHRPAELSGGQRQRVAIARALVTSPSLLLADEPSGNLDSATEAEIMRLLDTLHEAGNTIILVTHEPSIAARCPRVIRIADGRVVHDGPSTGRGEWRA
ncbi:MAG: ABC transporter ATP-binding protein [Nannocystaceae bacterium]|nr:ABC transporter ATP-binding protein [Nannocystaceae bacterium]